MIWALQSNFIFLRRENLVNLRLIRKFIKCWDAYREVIKRIEIRSKDINMHCHEETVLPRVE